MKKDISDFPKLGALILAIESGQVLIASLNEQTQQVEIYTKMGVDALQATVDKLSEALPKNEKESKEKSR